MGMLGGKFPGTQFVMTGLVGAAFNAHGPNEFLHIAFAKKLSAAIASVLADQRSRDEGPMLFDRTEPETRGGAFWFPVILATVAVGAAGSFITQPNIPTWYARPESPFHHAAQWVFAPVLDHALCH